MCVCEWEASVLFFFGVLDFVILTKSLSSNIRHYPVFESA